MINHLLDPWVSRGEIVGKYIIPAYVVYRAEKQEEIPEAHMLKCESSDSHGEWEIEVTKEMYDDAEIGDTYVNDMTMKKEYVKEIIKNKK
jgi:hypothetical protein